jgi:hypothetical protein
MVDSERKLLNRSSTRSSRVIRSDSSFLALRHCFLSSLNSVPIAGD